MFFLAEFATAVAGWVLEINPFDQPNVQEAKDATKRVLAAAAAAGGAVRRRRGAARAADRRRAGRLHRADGLPRAVGRVRRAGRRAAGDADDGHAPRDDVRLRAALPALDRPAAQGRPAGRTLPVADRRQRPRRRDPRRRLFLPDAEDRAGDRRPRDAALAQPAGRDRHAERRSGERACASSTTGSRRCSDADRLRRAGQDGRQHGRADPPRLRP